MSLVLLSLMVAACGSTDTVGPRGRPLPTTNLPPLPSGVQQGCSQVLRPGRLTGSAADLHIAWLIDLATGSRIDVTWPVDYSATFDSAGIHVATAGGLAVTSEGEVVLGGCDIGDPAGLLVQPPFPGYQLKCGPLDVTTCASKASGVADDSGWPARRLAEMRFTSAGGAYVVRYADGTKRTGLARP